MARISKSAALVWARSALQRDVAKELIWYSLHTPGPGSAKAITWTWLTPGPETAKTIAWTWLNPGPGSAKTIAWTWLTITRDIAKNITWVMISAGPAAVRHLTWCWSGYAQLFDESGSPVLDEIGDPLIDETSTCKDNAKNIIWDVLVPANIKKEITWTWLAITRDIAKNIIWDVIIACPAAKRIAWTCPGYAQLFDESGNPVLDEAVDPLIDETSTHKDLARALIWNSLVEGPVAISRGIVWNSGLPLTKAAALLWWSHIGTIIMAIDAYLKLVSDSSKLPIANAAIGIDRDSWAWSLSGNTLDYDAAAAMAPTSSGPIEVELNINTHAFRALVESVNGSWQFGSRAWTFSGRSPACVLADPYAPPTTTTWITTKNARQIVQEILSGTGISETWNITDWNILARTLAVNNAAKMDILRRIATATGAIIQATPAGSVLDFLYRYPYTPTAWAAATPEAVLSSDFTTNVSWAWAPQPGHDYVIVSGRDAGVLVHVKRTGASFTIPAETIIDPLIGQEVAGHNRGRALLDATGYDKRIYELECPFPLPSAAGAEIVYPGDIVSVNLEEGDSFKGMVDAVKIAIGGGRSIITITVERVSL